MYNKVKLLELMTSRMFHDLAGPVGATHNSVEFLEEENQGIRDKALNIIKTSSHESIIRLKFFRQAYGTVNDEEVFINNYVQLIEDFLSNSKLKIKWDIIDSSINSYLAKALLNFIVIAMGILIHGGEIIIKQSEEQIIIALRASNYILNEDTKLLLEGDVSYVPLTSSNIQIYYTYLMIEEAKAKLSINVINDGIDFVLLK